MFERLLPEIKGRVGLMNLADEATAYVLNNPEEFSGINGNPLIIGEICERVVEKLHKNLGVVGSYGGWLENRAELWRGSYLDEWGEEAIHLGQDFNFKAGTVIAAPEEYEVVGCIDDDGDDFGWGNRIFVRPTSNDRHEMIVLFAHISSSPYTPGQIILPGKEFTTVETIKNNGRWYGHFHVQAMKHSTYKDYHREGFSTLDGYARKKQKWEMAKRFPDPLPLLLSK